MSIAKSKTLGQFVQHCWTTFPEVVASSGLAIVGLGMATLGCYQYTQKEGDNRKFKSTYVIIRPDDPRVQLIRKEN